MELKNYLVEMLSNIIHDKMEMLSSIKDDIKKCEEYKKIENLLSDYKNVCDIDDDKLNEVLSIISDSETASEIVSNIDMIKIVVNGIDDGLDLSLDESQKELIKGVCESIGNYCSDVLKNNKDAKADLEKFISNCENLSKEIGTGVVRSIDVLDEIFDENDVPLDDVVKVKYEILRNNSKNYNMNLDSHVSEEVNLRLALKKINVDFDLFTDVQKSIIITHGNIDSISELISYIESDELSFSQSLLFILFMFSNVSNVKNIVDICNKYNLVFDNLNKLPGVFISSDRVEFISSIIDEFDHDNTLGLKYIGSYYETFNENISILESNNLSVTDVYNYNPLTMIIPDMSKNITILSNMNLSNEVFSTVVINPFLATSLSSFEECGLKEYLHDNPLRLTTSYYRLKNISANIIDARKNGKIIFRSLSDKKNYWLNKEITRNVSEVI